MSVASACGTQGQLSGGAAGTKKGLVRCQAKLVAILPPYQTLFGLFSWFSFPQGKGGAPIAQSDLGKFATWLMTFWRQLWPKSNLQSNVDQPRELMPTKQPGSVRGTLPGAQGS